MLVDICTRCHEISNPSDTWLLLRHGIVRLVLMDHVVVKVSMINPSIQPMQVHAYKYNGALEHAGANQNMRLTTLAHK